MKGESKVTIVCSDRDRASQNIKNRIFSLRKWDTIHIEDTLSIFEHNEFRLAEIKEPLIIQDGFDKKLADLDYPASLLIFASKHKSKDMRPILTVHSTGNVNEAKFGGTPKKLSHAAPQAVRSLLRSLKMLAQNNEYEVTLECTHHGPSDLDIPSVFIEVGSSEPQWLDDAAGKIVAEAILLLEESDSPVAVGFGGTHYAPRQTSLILSTAITFGHIFPSYALDDIDVMMTDQAFLRSGADFAYLDRKSMKQKQREKLVKIIEAAGFDILRESDIKEKFGVFNDKWKNYKSRDGI